MLTVIRMVIIDSRLVTNNRCLFASPPFHTQSLVIELINFPIRIPIRKSEKYWKLWPQFDAQRA